ncbi:MAG: hypothetical protein WBH85_15445 [Thermoanaerobaculia bacterium]
MSKVRLTISIEPELAEYLHSASNASAIVAEAVAEYRTRELEQQLDTAYREDAEESARLNSEWASADAEIEKP